jgi:hypothetical protein
MRKVGVLHVVFIFMFLVVFGGISNTVACDFSEGTDEQANANQIILSSAIHNDNSAETMTCEGIPYNDKEDKIIIASSRTNRHSSDSIYSEGISFEELEAVRMANVRERALNVKPAAGSNL